MPYADITFEDRNSLKRWLQRRRLSSALQLGFHAVPHPAVVCDYGTGDGAFCALLAERCPEARILGYEPWGMLLAEAEARLQGRSRVELLPDIDAVPAGSVDLLFCLEVFEHLPPRETERALRAILRLLKPDGALILGVPVEIGVPALYKGLFRMGRRYGSFDARPAHVVRALLGRPPSTREACELAPGLGFYHAHLGFDHRRLRRALLRDYVIDSVVASPFTLLGPWLMPEVYFVAHRAAPVSPEPSVAAV